MNPKPGWQTTEFWLTLLANIATFAVVFGLISKNDADTLQGALSTAIPAAFALIGSAMTIWAYIKGRMEVKLAEPSHESLAIVMESQSSDIEQAKALGIPWFTIIAALLSNQAIRDLIASWLAKRAAKQTPTQPQ